MFNEILWTPELHNRFPKAKWHKSKETSLRYTRKNIPQNGITSVKTYWLSIEKLEMKILQTPY